ncbi:MAG: hypothetical protein HQL70_06475 [Magnetococcales bacterium]|nr:hypothetical protein [Magnetococcales bacterium]
MKSVDNTYPFVLLELVIGAIFLLAIFLAVPVLNERIKTLSSSAVVDKLLPANSADGVDLPALKASINKHMQPVVSRFDDLDKSIDSRLSAQDTKLTAAVNELDNRLAEVVKEREGRLLPMLGDLNLKADSMLAEHENTVLPALNALKDNIALLSQEQVASEKPAEHNLEPVTSRVPMIKTGASGKVLYSIQSTLSEFNLKSKVGPGGGTLLLSDFFDFNRFATKLNDEQVQGLKRLADALAKILPCYATSAGNISVEGCKREPGQPGLDVIMIQSFSIGGNIGTLRINYNSKLANSRSIYILKTILAARPDLLDFLNSKGSPLFAALGKLAPSNDERSRRIVLQFIMEKPSAKVSIAN